MPSKPGVRHPKYRNCRTVENQAIGRVVRDERNWYRKYSNKSFYRVKLKEVFADAEHTG